jgi:hypothetical protein
MGLRSGVPSFLRIAAPRALAVLVPIVFTLRSLGNQTQAAHDANVVRAAGIGQSTLFHSLDALVASLFAWLPLGTHTFRLSLSSVAVAGLMGFLVFEITRTILKGARTRSENAAETAIALLASCTFMVTPMVQVEARAPAGALIGVTLVLACWASVRCFSSSHYRSFFLVGLCFAQEPLLGLAALVFVLATDTSLKAAKRANVSAAKIACAFGTGLAPLSVQAMRSRFGSSEGFSLSAALGDASGFDHPTPLGFVKGELGFVLSGLALLGVFVGLRAQASRRDTILITCVLAFGTLAVLLGAPIGPQRFGASVLLLLASMMMLAAMAGHFMIAQLVEAKIPFARASATLVVILFCAAPLRVLDETDSRLTAMRTLALASWEDLAFDALPPKSLVLIRDSRLWLRTEAARAQGSLRQDLSIVPTSALEARAAATVLAREPALAPLLRDILLSGSPQELTLSTLAKTKPLCVEFAHTWNQNLAKHLVPVGLFMQYEAEPRALSERKLALESQTVLRDRLARALMSESDPELKKLTIKALRLRAMSTALTGEKSSTVRTLEDLRVFSPTDAIMEELIRRALVSKGYIDITDLDPNR